VGSFWLVDRRVLARYVAPAVFLLAVTGIVLAVRAGLSSDSAPARTTQTVAVTTAAKPKKPATTGRYYVIQSGDTLGAVAARFGTTVSVLLRLNPGVEPTALIPGQRVRVE
jgi:LysM repeat protein